MLSYFFAALFAIVPDPNLPQPKRYDKVELNTWHSGGGSPSHQLVFWRWDSDFCRYRSCGFTILADAKQVRVERMGNREYRVEFYKGTELMQFRSPIFAVSETDYDPELEDRNWKPSVLRERRE